MISFMLNNTISLRPVWLMVTVLETACPFIFVVLIADPWLFFLFVFVFFSYDTWVSASEVDGDVEDPPSTDRPWKVSNKELNFKMDIAVPKQKNVSSEAMNLIYFDYCFC